jgi:hypothetical protein
MISLFDSMASTFETDLDLMRRAQAERKRIDQMNAEASKANIKRRAEGRSILRLPHRMPKWVVEAYALEVQRSKELSKKTPEQWREDILNLPAAQRECVAKVIFWDYFSTRTVAERWPHLDPWLTVRAVETKPRPLAKALWACGYTAYAATNRANQ